MPGPEQDPAPPIGLFRFFTHDDSAEPIQVIAPAIGFRHNLWYDGRLFRFTESTLPSDYPAGWESRFSCAWDFEEQELYEFHQLALPHEHRAHCIVCNAPFPLHTIRCGTAA